MGIYHLKWCHRRKDIVLYFFFNLHAETSYLPCSYMVFFIKPRELESRLTISIVVFLSLIAYNFVVSDDLPKIGYLTLIDSFILISYIFAGIPTIQTVMITFSEESIGVYNREWLDNTFRRYFLVAYVIAVGVVALPSFIL